MKIVANTVSLKLCVSFSGKLAARVVDFDTLQADSRQTTALNSANADILKGLAVSEDSARYIINTYVYTINIQKG